MKKFQFTLQKLMDFREQELDRQKNALAVLQGDLKRINDRRDELTEKVVRYSNDLVTSSAVGLPAAEISMRKRYIVTLQQEIHECEQRAILKQQEIDKQLSVVVDATKDVRTLEKLEEKQLEEYKAAEGKENELFIEEFVSGGAVRGAIAAQK
ncbi:MAG: flagellar export protein FliJ [Oscillospiraceae bacterium]|nr:flagellar export protein FliJ [Oscillospiraceae bacterium]